MAEIYFLRDGDPPDNIAYKKSADIRDVVERYGEYSFRFIRPSLEDDLPVINAESGQANPVSDSKHVVVRIGNKEIDTKRFARSGFYHVDGAKPY